MCYDSGLNLLKILQMAVLLFLWQALVFLFLPFLILGAQIRCLQNRYTGLKLALDQRMIVVH